MISKETFAAQRISGGLLWIAVAVFAIVARGLTLPLVYFFILGVGFTTSGILLRQGLQDEYYSGEPRKPANPRISYFLGRYYDFIHILIDMFWIFGIIVVIGSITSNMLIILSLGFVGLLVSRFLLANGTLRLVKRLLDRRFKIVLFRRFETNSADLFAKKISPVIGAYGRNVIIKDESLEQAGHPATADAADVLSGRSIALVESADRWRSTVLTEVKVADAAVFFWPCSPTNNMSWELAQSRGRLEAQRLIFLVTAESLKPVSMYLEKAGLADCRRIVVPSSGDQVLRELVGSDWQQDVYEAFDSIG